MSIQVCLEGDALGVQTPKARKTISRGSWERARRGQRAAIPYAECYLLPYV